MYRKLDPEKLIQTTRRLHCRIAERFPGSGLSQVCDEVIAIAVRSSLRCDRIAARPWLLRGVAITIVAAILAVLAQSIASVRSTGSLDLADFIQLLQAGIESAAMIGVALFSLVTVETRIKRRGALKALGELRALAHVVDMHQFTKDPERLLRRGERTPSSPRMDMNAFLLSRYLDYCSEILAVLGKIAALYAQAIDDPAVITAVNEIESLTTGLCRKIWQKIMILNHLDLGGRDPVAAPV